MDENFLEHAEAMESAERQSAIALASKKALPDKLLTPEQYKVTECEVCGDELPVFRMERGCLKCVICQAKTERRK